MNLQLLRLRFGEYYLTPSILRFMRLPYEYALIDEKNNLKSLPLSLSKIFSILVVSLLVY